MFSTFCRGIVRKIIRAGLYVCACVGMREIYECTGLVFSSASCCLSRLGRTLFHLRRKKKEKEIFTDAETELHPALNPAEKPCGYSSKVRGSFFPLLSSAGYAEREKEGDGCKKKKAREGRGARSYFANCHSIHFQDRFQKPTRSDSRKGGGERQGNLSARQALCNRMKFRHEKTSISIT